MGALPIIFKNILLDDAVNRILFEVKLDFKPISSSFCTRNWLSSGVKPSVDNFILNDVELGYFFLFVNSILPSLKYQ